MPVENNFGTISEQSFEPNTQKFLRGALMIESIYEYPSHSQRKRKATL